MNRRQLILSSLGYLAGLALSRNTGAFPLVSDPRRSAQLSRLFSDIENAKSVGRRYLAQYPEKSDRNLLRAELGLPDLGAGEFNCDFLEIWVKEAQQRDFSAGNTVIVNNWILSRTEAGLCALAALS